MAKSGKKSGTGQTLTLKRENAWDTLRPSEERKLEAYCADYRSFLSTVKTEREAYRFAVAAALDKGYQALDDVIASGASLAPGTRVYCGCRGKTLMLVHVGRRPLAEGLHVVGGHTDAPRLDAKPIPLYEDSEMVLLDTHYYGGIRKYQWVALPLAIHGTIVCRDGRTVDVSVGEAPEDPVFAITDLLPHLARDQRKKTLDEGISGEGLNVMFASRPAPKTGRKSDDAKGERFKRHALNLLHERYGVSEADLVSAELEIVPAGPARDLGLDGSMILGYAHDDRVCSYAALRALLDLKRTPEYTAAVLLCDKEEIGSVGATGMDSTFFENVVAELVALQEPSLPDLTRRRCLSGSRMLSADVNVLHDPNYPEVSSPNNMARLNAGAVVAKYTGAGGKSGSSEASAEFMADIRRIFDKAGVVWQTGELGKVDVGGGGTIAKFMARYGMDVVDCGPGVLSMHAPWEVVGKFDVFMTYKGYGAFLGDDRATRG